jgi:outer membrane protein TolC
MLSGKSFLKEELMRSFKIWLGLLAMMVFPVAGIQSESGVLQQYIQIGLENNLVLKQEHFSLKQSLSALREARGMFLPRLSLEARYSLAGGGRLIEIPVGELMNPVYQSLNSLLALNGLDQVFPDSIEDEAIPFLRPQEHETKLRLVQPLFHPWFFHQVRIRSRITEIQQARINAFKRELVADIKTAYFTYLKTLKIRDLLKSTRQLLEENLRVSQSLFDNNKVTEEIVFRSRAELSKLDYQMAEAEKNIKLASAYFNFLLNSPLDHDISESDVADHRSGDMPDLEQLETHALNHREEFAQAQASIKVAVHRIRLEKSHFLPTITAVLDYGFQGEQYRFNQEDDFWMASLVFRWNLFNGFQDSEKGIQARVEKQKLQARQLELTQQIRLQVRQAFHDLAVARKNIGSSQSLLYSREKAFHIVAKKYEQGMVPQIEYIQARNEYTRAGITRIIAGFNCQIMEARLERASAFFPLTTKEIE